MSRTNNLHHISIVTLTIGASDYECGKISSPLISPLQDQWNHTELRRSTSATTLTINPRVRGPCRKCRQGVVPADEEGARRKRTLIGNGHEWTRRWWRWSSRREEARCMKRRCFSQQNGGGFCYFILFPFFFFSPQCLGLNQQGKTGETLQAK